jgi:hypothetical protein
MRYADYVACKEDVICETHNKVDWIFSGTEATWEIVGVGVRIILNRILQKCNMTIGPSVGLL